MPVRSPRSRRRAVAALLALALVAAACSNDDSSGSSSSDTKGGPTTQGDVNQSGFNDAQFDGTPQIGGSITFGVESNIATLDPAKGITQPSDIDVSLAIYDQLITFDEKGDWVPALATSWKNSDDLKTWTIKVREGVQFQDGTPFNADAVVKQFERFKDPATACTCAPTVAAIESITAPDATTVVFQLKEPNAFLPSMLAGTLGFIASPTATAKWGNDYARHPVGTGPFSLPDFATLELEKNPDYWKKDDEGRKLPYLDQITVKPITDSKVRLQSLDSGDVDIIQTADTGTVASAVKADKWGVQKITGSSSTIVLFNLRKPPFNDVRLRRAAALSYNRDQLNAVNYGGARQKAFSPFATNSPFYADLDWPDNDVEQAKKLVAEVKADGGSTSYTSTCIATDEGRRGLSLTQANGKKIGLDAEVEFLDQGAYVNKVVGAEHDFTAGCFRSPQIADADGLYTTLHTGAAGNVMGYSNPEVDKRLEAIRKTTDKATHVKLLREIQEYLIEDVPSFPVLYDLFANIYNPKVSGLPVPEANFLGAIKFTTLYLKA